MNLCPLVSRRCSAGLRLGAIRYWLLRPLFPISRGSNNKVISFVTFDRVPEPVEGLGWSPFNSQPHPVVMKMAFMVWLCFRTSPLIMTSHHTLNPFLGWSSGFDVDKGGSEARHSHSTLYVPAHKPWQWVSKTGNFRAGKANEIQLGTRLSLSVTHSFCSIQRTNFVVEASHPYFNRCSVRLEGFC